MSSTYLDRFLDPITAALPPDVAATIANWRMDEATRARVEVLREKANAGTLTPEEDEEYKDFVEALDIISIFKLKARKRCA